MQTILVLGAGKSATVLIETLLLEAWEQDWFIHVADINFSVAESKIAGHLRARAFGIDLSHEAELDQLVTQADAVISMLPPPFHYRVALKCLQFKKHFLNASYLQADIQALDEDVRMRGLSFLTEMGLDPGIDHMSAMEMIHSILNQGGNIFLFRSHCGGLISPESDNNPWHYKISWNPRNIIMAGKDGANYLSNGQVCHVPYMELFDPERLVNFPGLGNWAWYPNRDSMPYIKKYELEGVSDFVRTTLRHPEFVEGWKKIVELGFTDDANKINTDGLTIREFFKPYMKEIESWDNTLRNQYQFLDLDADVPINKGMSTPADVLQMILENKLALSDNDKDMILMLHEIGYSIDHVSSEEESGNRGPSGNVRYKYASLMVKGRDSSHTAMAQTVGLPLAIAVRNILRGKISRKGVFIPIYPDVYEVVLRDLEQHGIKFRITE